MIDTRKTMYEAIKAIYQSKPQHLPPLLVHSNSVWPGPAMADTKGTLHMCEADFLYLKKMGAPTKMVREIDKTKSEHVFDVGQFNLEGLDPNASKARQVDTVMNKWGADVVEVEETRAASVKKTDE